jgi:hypothetical protein
VLLLAVPLPVVLLPVSLLLVSLPLAVLLPAVPLLCEPAPGPEAVVGIVAGLDWPLEEASVESDWQPLDAHYRLDSLASSLWHPLQAD